MTAENLDHVVKSWLKGTSDEPPDPRHAARPIMARVAQTRQRSRWWPLPSVQHTSAPASGSPETGFLPAAASGHTPTFTGRFMTMFSATKFVIAGVIVALAGGLLLIAQPFAQQGPSVPGAATSGPGSFRPAGMLAAGRGEHTATLLNDGRVLIVGGWGDGGSVAMAEVWDPATASFGPAGSLVEPRAEHTATLLPDGRVLIVGGQFGDGGALTSAEVWDPATTSFAPAGSLAEGHARHTATLLADGRVLIVGGIRREQHTARTAEVWDPSTASFEPVASLASEGGQGTTATLLDDGRVLIVGGEAAGGGPVTPAGVWDPVTSSFEPVGSLAEPRGFHAATLLNDGRVLVVGGSDQSNTARYGMVRKVAEAWDPVAASFAAAGSLAEGRNDGQTATLLPDGRVLVVGGHGGKRAALTAEVWDPVTASFSPAGSLAEPRSHHTATLLLDGRVLVVGDCCDGKGNVASAEVWEPSDG